MSTSRSALDILARMPGPARIGRRRRCPAQSSRPRRNLRTGRATTAATTLGAGGSRSPAGRPRTATPRAGPGSGYSRWRRTNSISTSWAASSASTVGPPSRAHQAYSRWIGVGHLLDRVEVPGDRVTDGVGRGSTFDSLRHNHSDAGSALGNLDMEPPGAPCVGNGQSVSAIRDPGNGGASVDGEGAGHKPFRAGETPTPPSQPPANPFLAGETPAPPFISGACGCRS